MRSSGPTSQPADRCCAGERGNCLHFTITAGNECPCPIAAPRSVFPPGQDKISGSIMRMGHRPTEAGTVQNWHSKSKRTMVTAQDDGAPKVAATKNRALALWFEGFPVQQIGRSLIRDPHLWGVLGRSLETTVRLRNVSPMDLRHFCNARHLRKLREWL